jgi:hypothetical protein
MTFREWLPITGRNRVALCLAALSLVTFIVWNCFPHYEYDDSPVRRIVATSGLWSDIFSPGLYMDIIRSPDIDGFASIASFLALMLNGMAVIVVIPFWRILHASSYLRIPIAMVNLAGGSGIVWILASGYASSSWHVALNVMALGMFLMAAAFFTFRNELALRDERSRL